MNLNRSQVLGNLVSDPEIRNIGQSKVANFRVAVNEKWKDKNTGELREKSEYIPCVAWGRLAEQIENLSVRKGTRVFFEGKFQTRKWQDQNGNDRYSSEIVAQGYDGNFIIMSSRAESAQPAPSEPKNYDLDDSIPF